tara:strand:+ start:1489 stop:1758 length:270 start_codon:yes stop_codon:yes gene_type:complete
MTSTQTDISRELSHVLNIYHMIADVANITDKSFSPIFIELDSAIENLGEIMERAKGTAMENQTFDAYITALSNQYLREIEDEMDVVLAL